MTTTEGLRSEAVAAPLQNRKLDLFLWESTRAESRPVLAYLYELGPLQAAAEAVWEGEYAAALLDVAERRLADKQLAVTAAKKAAIRKRLEAEISDLEAGISTLASKQ